jgi:DNA ligase-associated metallophosphoesterase
MISICGERLVPDESGVLHLPAHNTLIVSDLHLEKGSSYARRGINLPPYDTRTTLKTLGRVIRKYQPARVVSLGDSFHDPEGPERLTPADRDALTAMTRAHDWVWIAGNHEGLVDGNALGGTAIEEAEIGKLILRHEPAPAPATGEISGHLHPCGVVRQRGRRLRRRCFASDGTRLVMPAFGAYTGGLNVLDRAFGSVFDAGVRAWLMGETQVYPMPASRLVPDELEPARPSSATQSLRRSIGARQRPGS